MTPRILALLVLPIAVSLAVAAACGGDDDDSGDAVGGTGQITDPRTVPTATPWPAPPTPILLDPDNLTPVSGGGSVAPPENGDDTDGENGDGTDGDGDGTDGETDGPPPGECGGPTYTIEAGDNFFAIAEKCGLDPQAIIDANPDADPSALSVGQVINLPAGGDDESAE